MAKTYVYKHVSDTTSMHHPGEAACMESTVTYRHAHQGWIVCAAAVVGGVGNVYKVSQIFPAGSSSTASEEEKRKGGFECLSIHTAANSFACKHHLQYKAAAVCWLQDCETFCEGVYWHSWQHLLAASSSLLYLTSLPLRSISSCRTGSTPMRCALERGSIKTTQL